MTWETQQGADGDSPAGTGDMAWRDPERWEEGGADFVIPIYFKGLSLQVCTLISKHLFLASVFIKEATISLKEQIADTNEVTLS